MRGVVISVEYGDYLSITLPYNRHHFEEVLVITTEQDEETQRVAKQYDAQVYTTDAFYRDGALFNKWLALEEGLDWFGKRGLMAILDADIVWPKEIRCRYESGFLYGPYRYLYHRLLGGVPEECKWRKFPRKKEGSGFYGYTWIFWADDPFLPKNAPWFELDWCYAGGGDYSFQRRWPQERKRRTPWGCLHLGMTSKNWCGRVTSRIDGADIPEAKERERKLRYILQHCPQLKISNQEEVRKKFNDAP